MKNLFFALFAVLSIGFTSCGDDCDLLEFTTAADANLALGTTYAADSTLASCEAYKEDLEAIISDYDGCDDAIITAQVAAFQTQLDALDCQ